MMVDADNPALEEAKEALNRVGVDNAVADIFIAAMGNLSVTGKLFANADIALVLISHEPVAAVGIGYED